MAEYFRFGEKLCDHEIGNLKCPECFDMPKPCVCGGLVHNEFGDENWDGCWTYKFCDKCGEDWECDW